MILNIDGIPIEITRKIIKSMNLRVYPPDGLVRVSVPMFFSDKMIRRTLLDKLPWINAQRERFKNCPTPREERVETGSAVEFMGNTYLLVLEEHNGPSQVQIHDQLLHCYIQPQATPEQIQAVIDRWYKREMTALLPELINHWQTIVGVKVKEWGIKKMRTRWGSCNTRAARIWLNLSLIKKPQICLEYVLVHELVHLLEASHNRRFYALMTEFMPQWKTHQQRLEGKIPKGQCSQGDSID